MGLLLIIVAALFAWRLWGNQAQSGDGVSAPSDVSSQSDGSSPVDAFTEAWAWAEGYDKNGSAAQRYNNPVDVKGNWDGVVNHSPSGLAIFDDVDSGWAAADDYALKQAEQHPDWTFRQFFAKVLGNLSGQPVNNDQGNSDAEAQNVANYLGVPVDTTVSSYLGLS